MPKRSDPYQNFNPVDPVEATAFSLASVANALVSDRILPLQGFIRFFRVKGLSAKLPLSGS